MRKLYISEINEITGGISWGSALAAIAAGFITGGPVGAGIAASGVVAAQGIDNLHDLARR